MITVTSVQVLDGYRLRLGFSDGLVRDMDLTERLRTGGPVFGPLYEDHDLFARVYVDPEAGTIVWPNGADLAPEFLHGDFDDEPAEPTPCIDKPWKPAAQRGRGGLLVNGAKTAGNASTNTSISGSIS